MWMRSPGFRQLLQSTKNHGQTIHARRLRPSRRIYDYLRILFARVGKPHCLTCGRIIHRISKEEILETVLTGVTAHSARAKKVFGVDVSEAKVRVWAPVVVGRKGEYYQMLYDMLGKGYERVRVDGTVMRLRDQIILEKNKKHSIDVLVDEIFVSEFTDKKQMDNARERLSEALERAIQEADGLIKIEYPRTAPLSATAVSPLTPMYIGASGDTDSRLRGASQSKTIEVPSRKPASPAAVANKALASVKRDTAVAESDAVKNDETLMSVKFMCPYDGFSYPEIEPRLFSFNSPYGACAACNGLGTESIWSDKPCLVCKGARLREEALHVKIDGKNIVEVVSQSIEKAVIYFKDIKTDRSRKRDRQSRLEGDRGAPIIHG